MGAANISAGEPATALTALPQHLDALARANRARTKRAHVKRKLQAMPTMHAARAAAAALIETPPAELVAMRVFDLVRAVRHHGAGQARRLLRAAAISELATVGQITDRQRRALLAAFRF